MGFKEFGAKVKEKLSSGWEKAKETGKKTLTWVKENKELVVPAATAIVALGGEVYKTHNRRMRIKNDRDERNSRIYDPHTGRYHYLKRPMKSSEEREFNRRIKMLDETGETYYDILDDMHLLE